MFERQIFVSGLPKETTAAAPTHGGTVSTVQDAGSGCDSWPGTPVRQTPARAVDALRLVPRCQTCGDQIRAHLAAALITSHQMRAHFTTGPKWPAASGHVDRRG